MGNPIYVIAYDVGTTGVKTCLFSITDKIELLGAASEGYNLYVYPDGGAEQDPDEWWEAMRTSTHTVMKKAKIKSNEALFLDVSFWHRNTIHHRNSKSIHR